MQAARWSHTRLLVGTKDNEDEPTRSNPGVPAQGLGRDPRVAGRE